MSTPRLISALVKAVPTFTIGVVFIAASANVHQKVSIAQAAESDNGSLVVSATDRSFHPPRNAKRRAGYVTTTGSNTLLASRTSGTSFRLPRSSRRRGYTTVNGSRGDRCLSDATTALTTLGPDENATAFTTLGSDEIVGLTASTRPEFVWYLPASNKLYPVTFRLLAPNAEGVPTPVFPDAELTYTPGFTKYQLPVEVADLSPGIEYRWQVIVQCDPDSPSTSLVQELSFEVASPSTSLLRSLDAATTDADRALAYGQAGFWYDAIAQVAQSASPQAKAVRQSLLEDLANTAIDDEQIKSDILRIADVAN